MEPSAPNDAQIRLLIRAARQSAENGRPLEADQYRRQAETTAPRHPLVLNEIAMQLIRAGRAVEACKLLDDAVRSEPSNTEILYNHAVALRATGRPDEAVHELQRLLGIEPAHMAALLEKASLEEQRGDARAAAMTCHTALRLLPPNFKPPQWMDQPLKHAREVVEANNRALEAYIEDGLATLRSRHASTPLHRFDRCIESLLGKRKIFRQQPTFMQYPGLPAIEFYDRNDFPWLDELESAAGDIRAEFIELFEEGGRSILDPYVSDQSGLDLKYYRQLNRSRRWGVYSFWREGVEFREHIARCPRTIAALESWPKWDVPGSGPTALFSILDAKTRIPAHTGPVNTRLVVHLPLIVPAGCGFRVGGQVREWEPGRAFVFDDTIVHEAWNDSDQLRAVLIVDIWTPLLDATEREMVRALTVRMHEWYGPQYVRDLKSA